MAQQYCQHCGAPLKGDGAFCIGCGAPVLPQAAGTRGGGKLTIVIVIISAVIVLGVAAFIALRFFPADKSTPEPPADAAETDLEKSELKEHLKLGERYLRDGDYDKAIIEFTNAIKIDKKNVDAYIGRADAYAALEEYEDAVDDYEQALELDDELLDVYIKLADSYVELGNDDKAAEVLRRGLEKLPDNEKLRDKLIGLAPVDIVTIYDTVFTEQNGGEIGTVKMQRPVFRDGYKYADKFNDLFGENVKPLTQEEAQAIYQEEIDEAVSYGEEQAAQGNEYAYSLGYGAFYDETACEIGYNNGNVISFITSYEGTYPGAAHGWRYVSGTTVNLLSGEVLKITDILAVSPEETETVLYSEYIAQHADDGLGEMARGYSDGRYDSMSGQYWVDGVKRQCGVDAVFWLDGDGVHIYFEQYTFFYAAGDSELFIPYSRYDLINAEFAATAKSYQEAYLAILEGNKAAIIEGEERMYRDAQPFVAICDVYGDERPELLFIKVDSASLSSYSLSIWTYDTKPVALIRNRGITAEVAGWGAFGLAKLEKNKLLLYVDGGDEGWSYEYSVIELKDGRAVDATQLSYGTEPDYSYNNYWEMPQIESFFLDGTEISSEQYLAKRDELLSSIETGLFTNAHDSKDYQPFIGNDSVFYNDAVAELTR